MFDFITGKKPKKTYWRYIIESYASSSKLTFKGGNRIYKNDSWTNMTSGIVDGFFETELDAFIKILNHGDELYGKKFVITHFEQVVMK